MQNVHLGLGRPFFRALVGAQVIAWFFVGHWVGAPSLAVDRERGTFLDYVLAGLSAREIVGAKWFSVAALCFLFALVPAPALALCFWLGGVTPLEFASGLMLVLGCALFAGADGLWVSANVRTVSDALARAFRDAGIFLCVIAPFAVGAFWIGAETGLFFGGLLAISSVFIVASTRRKIDGILQNMDDDAQIVTPEIEVWFPRDERAIIAKNVAPSLENSVEKEESKAQEPFVLQPHAPRAEDLAPSNFDGKLLEKCAFNPLAIHELRRQLRRWRASSFIGQPPPLYGRKFVWLIGILSAFWGIWAPPMGALFILALGIFAAIAILQNVSLASGAFTSERAGNRLTALQLSALSSREIVIGKITASVLATARLWFYPLATLVLAALPAAFPLGLATILALSGAFFAATTLATLASLLMRTTSSASGFTFAFLGILASVILVFPLPLWMRTTILAMVFAFFGGLSLALCVGKLRRWRADDDVKV